MRHERHGSSRPPARCAASSRSTATSRSRTARCWSARSATGRCACAASAAAPTRCATLRRGARARRAGRRDLADRAASSTASGCGAWRSPTASSTCTTPARCCGCCPACSRASRRARYTLDGDESIRRRPVDRITLPLRRMGADDRAPPTAARRCTSTAAARCTGIDVRAAGRLGPGEVVRAAGRPAGRGRRRRWSSRSPTRDHTERLLRAAGRARRAPPGRASRSGPPRRCALGEIEVPGDISSAALVHRRRDAAARVAPVPARRRRQPRPHRAADGAGAHGRAHRALQPPHDRGGEPVADIEVRHAELVGDRDRARDRAVADRRAAADRPRRRPRRAAARSCAAPRTCA